MLERLEHSMSLVRNTTTELPVIRIAAEAALTMIGKYYALTDDNEVYRIAIAMCPDKKVEWFDKNPDWRHEDRVEARRVVRERWEKTYAILQEPSLATASQTSTTETEQPRYRKRSKWATIVHDSDNNEDSSTDPDSIEAYLDLPPVAKSEVKAAGGVLKYWENCHAITPRLARMALDFLSAPASSVDAERAFSGGRLQSFKAQVAVGSWYTSPLLSDTSTVVGMISAKMGNRGRRGVENHSAGSGQPIEIDSD
ncbi:hypothetical protein PAXINDRAFT_171565 [Paxillus involutus ATCC 200175]|uniref:HAT C-terminal dimerisation domain-containing protein n=1 Tax=Paxillus involutus ATCC 200175 TaxID=664439 RepID=A0A0C9T8E8_PAXIN|nr:hypothetical protein PAXINDRAFT_171565 [Paxillus involutus ATCC 200175]